MLAQLVLLCAILAIVIVMIAPDLTGMILSLAKYTGVMFVLIASLVVFRDTSLSGEQAAAILVDAVSYPLAVGVVFCLVLIALKHIAELLRDRYPILQTLHRERSWQGAVTVRELKAPALKPRTGPATAYAPGYPAISLLADNRHIIRLAGGIDEDSAKRFRNQCKWALEDRQCTYIRVELNSHGGLYTSHFEIRRAIQELAQHKYVEILVTGDCHSAAITVLTCIPVHHRMCLPQSTFIAHAASNNSGIDTDCLAKSNELLIATIVAETHIDEKSLRRLFQSRGDYFFNPQTALHLGVIGHIVPDVAANS